MTYITFKENNGAGIGHNSYYIYQLFWVILKNKNLKYICSNFIGKSNYYDIILQYDKLFPKYDVDIESLNKINVNNINDLHLDNDNTLLIVNQLNIDNYFRDNPELHKICLNEIGGILSRNTVNIRNFLKNDIDYDINSINITLHIRRGDIMVDDLYLTACKNRYLSNEYYVNILNKLKKLNLGKLKINLVSIGEISYFESDFKDFDINYILGTDSKDSDELKKKNISYLIFNDILVMAPSGLSDICTIYSTGLVLMNNVTGILKNQFPSKNKELDIDNMNRDEILNKIY